MNAHGKTRKNAAVRWLLYALVVFAFQEVVFRLLFPLPELSNFDRVQFMSLDAGAGTQPFLRDGSWYWESQLDTAARFVHHMNRYGFRDAEWTVEKPAGKQRVMIVGDSFVEGIMAEDDQTIPTAFQRAAGDSYQVLNCGMMGVGIQSYLQLVADAVPVFEPDVVFVVLFSNDIPGRPPVQPTARIEPEYHNCWLPRFVAVLQQGSNGNPVNWRFGGEARPYLPALPAPNNPWTKKEAELRPHTTEQVANAMRSGQLNPFRVNQLAREDQVLRNVADFGATFPYLKSVAEQYGTEVVVCYLPARHQVTNHYLPFEQAQCTRHCPDGMDLTGSAHQVNTEEIVRQCAANALPFINLSDAVYMAEAEGNHLFWNYDDHMRGSGYTLLGKTLYQKWKGE